MDPAATAWASTSVTTLPMWSVGCTFADLIDPALTSDAGWLRLARQLNQVHAAGIDHTELRHVATHQPLPDEQPADALLWRVAATLAERNAGAQATAPIAHRDRTAQPHTVPRPCVDYQVAFGGKPTSLDRGIAR